MVKAPGDRSPKNGEKKLPFHTFNRDAFILTLRDLQQSSGWPQVNGQYMTKYGHRYDKPTAAWVNMLQSCFTSLQLWRHYDPLALSRLGHVLSLVQHDSNSASNRHLLARVGANSLRQGLCRGSEMQIGAGRAVSR